MNLYSDDTNCTPPPIDIGLHPAHIKCSGQGQVDISLSPNELSK